jgi:Tol biopolymer transport system component
VSRNRRKFARRSHRSLAIVGLVAAQAVAGVGWSGTAHAAPSTTRVSVATAGQQANGASASPAVSIDGAVIAFSSSATNLAPGAGAGQVYVRDKVQGRTDLVSKKAGGVAGNGSSVAPAVSGDGRLVAFQSRATNLVSGDTNGVSDVFVHDRATGATTRVSLASAGRQGNGLSAQPAISEDGRYVAFASTASNLVPGDTNGAMDVFVHDRVNRTTTRASVSVTGAQANGASSNPSIARFGGKVAFQSSASNLVAEADTNGAEDVFVGTRTKVQLRASQSSSGTGGNASSRDAAISANGLAVAFQSGAGNLVAGDTNSRRDIFRHGVATRETTMVSKAANGGVANGDSLAPSISDDGHRVAYSSAATDLVGRDANGTVVDVVVTDVDAPAGSQNTLASVASGGAAANGASGFPAISADGRVTAFHSNATNLVAADTNQVLDVFARIS